MSRLERKEKNGLKKNGLKDVRDETQRAEEEHTPMYHVPMFDLDFSLETRVECGPSGRCDTRPC